jgi:hypothetical protein
MVFTRYSRLLHLVIVLLPVDPVTCCGYCLPVVFSFIPFGVLFVLDRCCLISLLLLLFVVVDCGYLRLFVCYGLAFVVVIVVLRCCCVTRYIVIAVR